MQLSTFGTEFPRTKREGKVAESVVLSEVSGVSMAEGNDSLPRVLINQLMKFDDSLACFLIFRRVGGGMTIITKDENIDIIGDICAILLFSFFVFFLYSRYYLIF